MLQNLQSQTPPFVLMRIRIEDLALVALGRSEGRNPKRLDWCYRWRNDRALRSIRVARGRSFFWTGLISIVCSAALAWLARHGLAWLHVD